MGDTAAMVPARAGAVDRPRGRHNGELAEDLMIQRVASHRYSVDPRTALRLQSRADPKLLFKEGG